MPIYRGREVTDFTQDDSGVDVTLSDGNSLRAEYLVGCDGGRSVIRKGAGIEFRGWDPTTSWMIAELQTSKSPSWACAMTPPASMESAKTDKGVRIVLTERAGRPCERTDAARCERRADRHLWKRLRNPQPHLDLEIHRHDSPGRGLPRSTRPPRRRRRDIHPPVGGQGLNIGVQDAVNLGWKLAQVIKQTSPESLLDTYHAERHPVAARVLKNTMAQTVLRRQDDRTKAVGDFFSEFLAMDEPRKRMVAEMSGLDVYYDLPSPGIDKKHPLLGRRMPDLDLETANGPQRVFTLLHQARPVLLNFGEPASLDIAAWADRVPSIDAKYVGPWELPAIGAVTAPSAVLVRPDGHVAWVGDGTRQGLTDALTLWFGPLTRDDSRTDG